jgi:hypothetical protein
MQFALNITTVDFILCCLDGVGRWGSIFLSDRSILTTDDSIVFKSTILYLLNYICAALHCDTVRFILQVYWYKTACL